MTTYIHMTLGKGRVTAVLEVKDLEVSTAFSFSSPEDRFVKRKGRAISSGRLLSRDPRYKLSFRLESMDQKVKAVFIEHFNKFLTESRCS